MATRRVETLAASLGLGAMTGVRSMSALAVLALQAQRSRRRRTGLFANEPLRVATGLFAAGEFVADKLPFVPARTEPLPLLTRVLAGAFAARTLAGWRREPSFLPTIAGAAAALAAAAGATHLRRVLTRDHDAPDFLIGIAEDAAVLSTGAMLDRALRR